MLDIILKAVLIYISTALDLIIILMLIFRRVTTRKQIVEVYIGQYIGSVILISISLLFAYIFHFVPEDWILGIMGIVPIAFGLKMYFWRDDESKETEDTLHKRGMNHLVSTVILLTVASCGVDNLGIFIPYFSSISVSSIIITILVFMILIYIMLFFAEKVSKINRVSIILEKLGTPIISIIYILIGIYILFDSGTISHLLTIL